ncbi:MAG: low molecular weight protein-tyrosine-phosphatase [Pseudomonadota bacterium]
MTRVLFVCLGNICRSPAAEGVLRAKAKARGLSVIADSAGTGGWHVGDPPDDRMRAAALNRGYDLSAQRARQVSKDDFETFDYVLAMDASNLSDLQAIAPPGHNAIVRKLLGTDDVPDPYYGGDDGFDHVLDLVEVAVDALIAEVGC